MQIHGKTSAEALTLYATDALLFVHFQGNTAVLRMLDVQRLEHLSLEMDRERSKA